MRLRVLATVRRDGSPELRHRRRRVVLRVLDILASRDRGQSGKTAPAHGLCLVQVSY